MNQGYRPKQSIYYLLFVNGVKGWHNIHKATYPYEGLQHKMT